MGPEARIQCPQCGGLIHPVAGRCKHCKTDLAAMRGGKPQSASTLPSLGNRTTNDRPIAGPPMPARLRGRAPMPPVDPMTAEFSMSSPLPSAYQVLPPRQTGRLLAVPSPPAWPLVVIALSVLAIVLSIGAIVA